MEVGTPIAQYLESKGFRPSGSCRCDGYFTLKFRKGVYEIKWRKAKYTFKIMEQNSTLHNWQPLENLENTLNELDQKLIQASPTRKTV
jgi:hypothetical protein